MQDYKKYVIVKKVDLPETNKYHGLTRDNEYEHLNTLDTLGVPMGEVPMTEEEVEFVKSLPQVDFVEEVKTLSIPTPQISEEPQGADDLKFHRVNEVHQRGYKGKGVKVAVLDTGLDETHKNQIGSTVVAIQDFTGSPSGWNDRQGHGTHCCGVVMQVAPEASLIVGKVLGDNGSGTTTGIIRGINWAVAQGAQVISQSLGSFPDPEAATDSLAVAVNAARDKGVLMPCAAGNDQDDYPTRECADENGPGAARGAQCVAAVDRNSNIAYFSNMGDAVDIAAVGVNVMSWGKGGTFGVAMSGTSMATPHIAGIVTLLLSAASGPDRVEQALYRGARNTSLDIKREGYGIADALGSLLLLIPEDTPVPTEPEYPRISLNRLDEERGELLYGNYQLTIGAGENRKDIGVYLGAE